MQSQPEKNAFSAQMENNTGSSELEKNTSSQLEKKTSLFDLDKPIVRTVGVGLFFIATVAVFFTVTRGSDFCIFTIGSCTDGRHTGLLEPIAVGAGLTAAVGLTVLELPATVAVGVGLAIWLIVNSLF
ncbi:hypothetical protein DSM106972_097840 [Dulcicalothrix desertica PCC 7102]|uniref:Uncharacterized protein n=1 Tax=Dulcicalothrix desertica PCC 7102 TaxID=232991 RepID=A0A3S1BPS8_9CYAN|nr:hypothetical protein [Dulcicalothrix desertica]RUS92889.1 hypothetical protein DSM106972_097840 [Dulcicalothrix desertica PCC 7102]TWH61436.1 hypothetical protein CAL7102_01002 [Dulcicalothrix desertica PCC 7102]